jgi:transcriptional regulator with XRE-family HTH domain
MPDLSLEIRKARRGKGLSIRALARMLDVSYTYISHIEAGRTTPSREVISHLAEILGGKVDEWLVMAGHLPEEVYEAYRAHPQAGLIAAREGFARYRTLTEEKEY